MHRIAVLALILAAGPAQAMLPPCEYDNLVRLADTVVQIADITVQGDPATGDCIVTGAVVAVLRGTATVGDGLTVPVACEWDGMVGGTIYHDRAALQAAPMIELHLSGGTVAGYGAGLNVMEPADMGRITHHWNCEG